MNPDTDILGREVAQLAILKNDLLTQLSEVREELKEKCKQLELPIIVVLNNRAVHITKPQWPNGHPQCKVAPVVCGEPCQEAT